MVTVEQVKAHSDISNDRVRLFYVRAGCLGKWEDKLPIDWAKFTEAINKSNLIENDLLTIDEFKDYIRCH